MASSTSKTTNLLQLKIVLDDTKPPVWRRVQVRDDITLGRLHRVVQIVMGWEDSHLHQFEIAGQDYGVPMPECDFDVADERKTKLRQLNLEEKSKFEYVYDFGDNWRHTIRVEKVLPSDQSAPKAVCMEGKLACPPEDCGSVWGYEEIVEMLKDPNHPDREERLQWLNHWYEDGYDPELFDCEEVNRRLQKMR